MRSFLSSVWVLAGDVGLAIQAMPNEPTHFSFKGSCTYYVITDRGGGSLQMITVLHRGGSIQMITVLHRGGSPNDYGIT